VVPERGVAFRPTTATRFLSHADDDDASAQTTAPPAGDLMRKHTALSVTAGFASSMLAFASSALAVTEELEMAELPPPYVPVIFTVGLLVGAGVLTGSLGNVIDEEAMLGMQSGARAKKEIERSRSNYFKKK
jgi:hypothetical protein